MEEKRNAYKILIGKPEGITWQQRVDEETVIKTGLQSRICMYEGEKCVELTQ